MYSFLAALGLQGRVGFSRAAVCGLLIAVASAAEHELEGTQASEAAAPGLRQLWRKGLAAPRHVQSSRTRDQTCVSCISRQILYH